MKKIGYILSAAGISFAILWGYSCSSTEERYVDLSTGRPVNLEKDGNTGLMVDKETKMPVGIYVDTKKNDTILGTTGAVINGHVVKLEDHKYVYDGDDKLKVGNDGSIKYKDGDYKVKIEEDGETKSKNDETDRKVKTEDDVKKLKKD